MAALTVNTVVVAGVEIALENVAAGGDTFVNDGRTFVEIRNSSGSNAYTVTFVTSKTYKGHAIADQTLAVGTSEEWVVGPFPTDVFNTAAGVVSITYSGSAPATDLDIGVFKLPG